MLNLGFHYTLTSKISITTQMTFKDFHHVRFTNWYEKQAKKSNIWKYSAHLQKEVGYFYNLKVRDITGQDIEDWIYELSQTATRNSRNQDEIKPLSRNYVNRILGHLKIILDRAVREGFINKNPAEDVSSFLKENNKVDFWELEALTWEKSI